MATTEATLTRTNERPGTRARLKGLNTSAYKVREVLDLIRGKEVSRANEILQFCERGPAVPVQKLLNSAVANAENNDELSRDELFVSACFADEGATMKRMKPGARGRAGRIRKRTCQITIVVARLPEDRLERVRAERAKTEGSRRRRVAGSRSNRTAASKKADQQKITEEEVDSTEEVTPVPEEAIADVAETETDSTQGTAAVEAKDETIEPDADATSDEEEK
jgi:large subunit ribosomal protein L22